jgi:hypothetical protein
MGFLATAYPKFKLTQTAIRLYWHFLGDLPFDVLTAAAEQCIVTGKFFPTVAEIREQALSLTPRAQVQSAAEAWGEVMREIRRVGHVGKPRFANPVTARVVAALGWFELCTSENIIADRAHFMRMYDEMAERVAQESRLTPLAKRVATRYAESLSAADQLAIEADGTVLEASYLVLTEQFAEQKGE